MFHPDLHKKKITTLWQLSDRERTNNKYVGFFWPHGGGVLRGLAVQWSDGFFLYGV